MNYLFYLVIVISYLLGAIPMSYLVARYSRGIDIRQYGSGHVGAGNIRRTISMKAAVPVALYDFFKGAIILLIAEHVVGLTASQLVIVGIAALAGHNWPVFLRFNGGRGLATAMGVAFYLMPVGILFFLAVASTYFLVKSTPLPVIAAMGTLPLASILLHQPIAITIGLLVIFLILVIRRLTAPKSALSATVSTRELMLNRLLFDRDIKDAMTWMYRKPEHDTLSENPVRNQKNREGA
jgi:glycerol-3-phosphate acyltransferase PlsY